MLKTPTLQELNDPAVLQAVLVEYGDIDGESGISIKNKRELIEELYLAGETRPLVIVAILGTSEDYTYKTIKRLRDRHASRDIQHKDVRHVQNG